MRGAGLVRETGAMIASSTLPTAGPRRREPVILLAVGLVALVVSAIGAKSIGTWFLEVLAALIGAVVLVATYRRFPLTPLAYRLILAHAVILMIGGHWTYAEVPAGDWLRDALGLARNPYDRLGHFAQGFVPAVVAREILLRCTPLRPGRWLAALVLCVVMAVSATWELFEWLSAVVGGSSAEDFLGTQGDVWDTQWDMFMAGVGAITSLVLLSRLHDKQLREWLTPTARR
ncbi:putative membrane protein [Paractinoplanes brasiliensis]|uniref:Putative membrane protein n=2 Tax=Paractinoplanes brasiliensis TaxID=52695 RepID=A0A4V3C679_9ACTN|nr:putative membrane protein [Actinoplanes brasiliensis]GID32854.1 inner membrane protein YjdF [Actinoplanes brasiliensis]